MSADNARHDPDCDAITRGAAYAICAQIYPRNGCICASSNVGPCRHMTLAACAAEKIITEQREARG